MMTRAGVPRDRGCWRAHLAVLVVAALATVSRAGAAASGAPPDPGASGDWLIWVWIDTGPGEHREPLADLVGGAILRLADASGWLSPADRSLLIGAMQSARKGQPAGLWLLPRGGPGQAQVVTRVGERGPADSTSPHADPVPTVSSDDGAESRSEWPAHRAAASDATPESIGSVELAVNVNALRHHLPLEFEAGDEARGSALLRAIRLSNARTIGLHGRIIDPARVATRDPSLPRPAAGASPTPYRGPALFTLAATWTARSEPPGRVHLSPLTTVHWPSQQLGVPPDDAVIALAARVQWRSVASWVAAAHAAMLPAAARAAFATDWTAWKRDRGSAADRLAGGLEPWASGWVAGRGDGSASLGWSVACKQGVTAASAAGLLSASIAGNNDVLQGDPNSPAGACVRFGPGWEVLEFWFRLHDAASAGNNTPARPARIEARCRWTAAPAP